MSRPNDAPITAAFYLPQFHQIPENDEWWGEGFTEWTNVGRARPAFEGHVHPVEPTGPFGQYDLTNPEVVAWQVECAAANDVDAFVYYHYWFDGKRLLEKPLDGYLKSDNTHAFALCWANENWTRRWDGKEQEVLLGQDYRADTASLVFDSFLPYLSDPRYLRVDGKAVLLVHRADHLPDPASYAATWRRLARETGVGELWLVASETSYGLVPDELGFDAIAEFPPVGDSTLASAAKRLPRSIDRRFKGRLNLYSALRDYYTNRQPARFVRHPTVVPRWDNTARRGLNATCFMGSSPAAYGEWLRSARERERADRGANGLVFINAWNEWAEGAYLEPDATFGSDYLDATRWDWSGASGPSQAAPVEDGRVNLRGLAFAAASSTRQRIKQRSGE